MVNLIRLHNTKNLNYQKYNIYIIFLIIFWLNNIIKLISKTNNFNGEKLLNKIENDCYITSLIFIIKMS